MNVLWLYKDENRCALEKSRGTTIFMELRSIPLSYLASGDRVLFGAAPNGAYGTIRKVDLENQQIAIQMDDSDQGMWIEANKLSDQLSYQGRWKQYCIYSLEAWEAMGGNIGKFGAQTAHAFQFSEWDSQERFPLYSRHYRKSLHSAKICMPAANEEALRELYELYHPIVGSVVIRDAAHTVFKEPTVTTLGIGPIRTDDYGDMREPILKKMRPLQQSKKKKAS